MGNHFNGVGITLIVFLRQIKFNGVTFLSIFGRES